MTPYRRLPLTPGSGPGQALPLCGSLPLPARGERGGVRGPRKAMSATRRFTDIVIVALLFAYALPLTGCGKKNAPEPPPGVPNTYPLPYPRE